jgi:hypothetical protein
MYYTLEVSLRQDLEVNFMSAKKRLTKKILLLEASVEFSNSNPTIRGQKFDYMITDEAVYMDNNDVLNYIWGPEPGWLHYNLQLDDDHSKYWPDLRPKETEDINE